jgi:hypothetical protein
MTIVKELDPGRAKTRRQLLRMVAVLVEEVCASQAERRAARKQLQAAREEARAAREEARAKDSELETAYERINYLTAMNEAGKDTIAYLREMVPENRLPSG